MHFLFLACTPAADDAADVTVETAALAGGPMARSVPVLVTVPEGATGKIAFHHMDTSDTEPVPSGSILAEAAITDGRATLFVPARAPKRDRDPADATKSVFYVVVHIDEDGVISGLSSSALAFVTSPGETDARKGWNVLSDMYDTEMAYEPLATGMHVDIATHGDDDLGIGGQSAMPYAPDQRVGLFPVGDASELAYDAPMRPDWTITVAGRPVPDSVGGFGESEDMALYEPAVFVDEDDGGRFDPGDKRIGMVCAGATRVGVAWIPPVTTVLDALRMVAGGLQSGWMLYDLGATEFVAISDLAAESPLDVRVSCDVVEDQ